MKTKGLLLAGAVASMFAACTNEIEMSTQSVNTADRLSAGEVVLRTSFYDEDAINTRAQWNADKASWVFSDPEDRFGVMLMDTWDQKGSGIDHYTFVDYVHTNYPFHSEDGGYTWKAPENSVLCEGNYFFTYPFDPDFTSRGNVYFEIPTKQYMQVIDKETKEPIQGEDNEVTKENAVRNYQKYLGYAFIAADETVNEVNVKFHSLFANPKFKIQNLTGGTVRLIKLVVRTAQNGPAGTPALMPTKLQLAPYSGNFASETQKKYANGELSSEEETAYLFSHATKVLNGSFGENSNEGTYEYILDCGDNYEISNQEFIKLSAIMPAGEYHDFDVYAFVQLPNSEKTTGVIRLNNVSTPSWTNMDTQSGSMQTVLKPGIQQVYSASFDAGAIQNLGLQDFTVVNSEDLAWIIDLKAKDGGQDLVIIKTLGDQVEVTKEVYSLIKDVNRKGIKWQIDGKIVIPEKWGNEDLPMDVIDQLTTGSDGNADIHTTIINKATQKLTKDLNNCDVENYGTITEDENDAITIDGNVIVKAGEVVVSTVDGDLTVEAGATATVGLVTGTITNNGTVTVSNVQGDVNNYGTATIGNAEDKKIINYTSGIMSLIGNKYAGQVANYGTMTIDEATEFTYKGATDGSTPALYNEGTLTFNKDVTVSDVDITFVNNISNPEIEATVAKNVSVIFSRIYNNAGTLTIEAGAKVTSYKNLADKIVNEAGATINNNGTLHNVLNRGMIVTGSGSDTVVTGGNGTIDNSAIADVVYNKDQTCLYKVEDVTNMTFDELQENVNNADANRLEIVAGTLTLETNSTLKGRVAHETTGYFAKGVDFGTVTIAGKNLLIIYTDQMTISDDETYIDQSELVIMKTGSEGTTLTIKEGARLDISNNAILRGGQNAKLTIALEGNVHNNGTVKYIANPNDCKTESDNHWTGNAAVE